MPNAATALPSTSTAATATATAGAGTGALSAPSAKTLAATTTTTTSIIEMELPKQKDSWTTVLWKGLSCCWGATSGLRDVLTSAASEALGAVFEDGVRDQLGSKLTDAQLKAIANAGKAGISAIIDNTATRLDHYVDTHSNADYLKSGEALSGAVVAGVSLIPGADKVLDKAKPSIKKAIITDKAFAALTAKMAANGGTIDLSQLDSVEVVAYDQIIAAVKESVNANPDLTPQQKSALNKTGAMSALAIEWINQQNKLLNSKATEAADAAGTGLVATAGRAGTDEKSDIAAPVTTSTAAGTGIAGAAIAAAAAAPLPDDTHVTADASLVHLDVAATLAGLDSSLAEAADHA